MSVTAVRKDPKAKTLTLNAEFDASPERVWQLWEDASQLERWWGPPSYPATFTKHDLTPGSRTEYHMTGPNGERPRGLWEIREVEPPHRLVFQAFFANPDGTPDTTMGSSTMRVQIEAVRAGRTRMTIETVFPSVEVLEKVLAMGMEEGLKQAVGQIDGILVAAKSSHRVSTHTLAAAGAKIVYDIHTNGPTDAPVLLMIGSPMGAAGFGTLASHFPDRRIVTYDPRGSERSTKDDPTSPSTPEQHADDVHRLIDALEGGPVDLFASSGGAVNALALVARHPEQVRTLVAHEPPLCDVLPDRDAALAAAKDVQDTYMRSGFGAGMAKFIALVSHTGPVPRDWAARPAPDPAMFGLPAEDDGTRTDPLMAQNMTTCTGYVADFDAIRRASTRVVIAAGAESEGQVASRAAHRVAERLGTEVVIFPSGHGGFLGGEYGQSGQPEAFAKKLREVLGGAA
ncbi:MAG: alpha/beta fold hydrolase [Gemmatimonadales bacterium]